MHLGKYLNHHIVTKIRLNPAPTSAKELDFIYTSFSRLGRIESFQMKKPVLHYPQEIKMILNLGTSSPFNPFEAYKVPNQEDITQQRTMLKDYLNKIVALPRYQYIENDEGYFSGERYLQFNHSLTKHGGKFQGLYEITDSWINQPFCLIKLNHEHHEHDVNLNMLKSCIRFNFEKFSKIEIDINERNR